MVPGTNPGFDTVVHRGSEGPVPCWTPVGVPELCCLRASVAAPFLLHRREGVAVQQFSIDSDPLVTVCSARVHHSDPVGGRASLQGLPGRRGRTGNNKRACCVAQSVRAVLYLSGTAGLHGVSDGRRPGRKGERQEGKRDLGVEMVVDVILKTAGCVRRQRRSCKQQPCRGGTQFVNDIPFKEELVLLELPI